MKWRLLILCICLQVTSYAQLLTWSPDFIRESGTATVEITMDAAFGNKGLLNYSSTSDVYVHTGVITTSSTSSTDWRYVRSSSFNTPNAQAQCTYLGSNRWKFTIPGGLRTYYGITNTSEKIRKIAILFRNGNGTMVQRNSDGTDMYIPVYEAGLAVRIDQPTIQPLFSPAPEPIQKNVGENISILSRSSDPSTLKLMFNGTQIASQSGAMSVTASATISSGGMQVIMAEATDGTTTIRDSVKFFVASPAPVIPVPAGMRDGINYEPGDTSVTLVLHAPGKTSVHVIGDFNNWTQSTPFQLAKSPDGNKHWIRITGLTPGTEYGYQFLVDGSLKIADPYTEKILDPSNDLFIPPSTYPNLKPYPLGKTSGNVSVLQTRKPAYTWKVPAFNRPDKRNLIIYELLLRDFVSTPNWAVLIDTLSYLKRLGVNVIQLMPVNEFEGNNSWGYNPSFFFAPDKFYGTENEFRRFVDSCHRNGMAVVLDIAMNHAFGQSPLVQLYFDAASGKPASNSPWFNADAKHPYNVGYDFNHESQATKDLVDRVIEHWLVNYKIDGFRWDLSKGFTQVNNPTNVAAWGQYDASRIALWKKIYDKMQATSAGSYCILEHFADNSEELELSDYGMLLWGNANYNFNEATMGFLPNSDFRSAIAKQRNWSKPHLIAYQESHDEERLMFKNINFGNISNGSHNVRTPAVALERNAMAAAFWSMIPGPKMMWQFGELGYDYSITYCPSTSSVPQPYPNMQCRTDMKPPRWDYRQDPDRQKLWNVYSAMLQLRNTPNFLATFTTNRDVESYLSGRIKTLKVWSDSLKVVVVGNFDVTPSTDTVSFPGSGIWYDYLNQTTFNATGTPQNITLQPGEYHVYLNRNVRNTLVTSLTDIGPDIDAGTLVIYPNPVSSRATLNYEMPVSGKIEISIWNLQGRKLSTIYSGMKSKGSHSVSWDTKQQGARMPSGQYLMVLDMNGRRTHKTFLIID